jgi:hypothetical protein
LPSSRGTKGTGGPGLSELWTLMDAMEVENRHENRVVAESGRRKAGKTVRSPARERIQPLAGVGQLVARPAYLKVSVAV